MKRFQVIRVPRFVIALLMVAMSDAVATVDPLSASPESTFTADATANFSAVFLLRSLA